MTTSADRDPAWLTIAGAQRELRAGELSAVELTEAVLARVQRLNPELRAYLAVDGEAALAQARAADRGGDERPLRGIPICVKDVIDAAGFQTDRGSCALEADADARCAGGGAAAGRGSDRDRKGQYERVRVRDRRAEPALGRLPESVRPRPPGWWLELRPGGRDGVRDGAGRHRHGHHRFDPRPCIAVRAGRGETDTPHPPTRRGRAAGLVLRHGRAAHPIGRGRRDRARSDEHRARLRRPAAGGCVRAVGLADRTARRAARRRRGVRRRSCALGREPARAPRRPALVGPARASRARQCRSPDHPARRGRGRAQTVVRGRARPLQRSRAVAPRGRSPSPRGCVPDRPAGAAAADLRGAGEVRGSRRPDRALDAVRRSAPGRLGGDDPRRPAHRCGPRCSRACSGRRSWRVRSSRCRWACIDGTAVRDAADRPSAVRTAAARGGQSMGEALRRCARAGWAGTASGRRLARPRRS